MRIATVVRGFHKHGGISRCAAELSDRFSQSHEVHVFTNHFESENNELNYHRIRPNHIKYPRRLTMASGFGSFAFKSHRNLKKYGFDIVHVHSSSCLVQDIITAHSCHKASLATINGICKNKGSRFDTFKILAKPFNFVNYAIEKIQYTKGNYKKIIAVSNSLKQQIVDSYKVSDEDIVVIPNGVDMIQFSPDNKARNEERKRLGYKDDDIVISFVTHRFAHKGLDYLIEALSLLKNKKIKLLIASGDDATEHLKLAERIEVVDQIKLYGETTEPEKAYRASDIFVLPSLYEGFGLVTLEAMATGLPVIATAVGGAPDIITDGMNGFLVPLPPSPQAISEIISTLCNDEKMRKRIGAAARKRAEQLSWDDIAAETMKLYKECM
jgi:UDP-glucose:(heptosyl)LPS alpha-1,3-glucosyltransferase